MRARVPSYTRAGHQRGAKEEAATSRTHALMKKDAASATAVSTDVYRHCGSSNQSCAASQSCAVTAAPTLCCHCRTHTAHTHSHAPKYNARQAREGGWCMCPPGLGPIRCPELSGYVPGPRASGHRVSRRWCRRGRNSVASSPGAQGQ